MGIETGLPIPPLKNGGRKPKWPFDLLQVGESFLARSEPIHRLRTSASRYAKKYGYEYAVRSVEGGTRVWRTA